MSEDQYAAYREYLREGMRVEVGIPLSGGGVFRDWAVISESADDRLLMQISRDVLPLEVRIEEGSILDLSIWIRKEAYTCSGIVTEKQGARVLRLQLFGNFTLRERRQFFRISLNLRLSYALPPDGDRDDIESDWERRRDLEHMKFQGYDEFALAAHEASHQPVMQLDWHDLLWAETSLSGGGMRISFPEPVHPDQLVALDIRLPLDPPRQVQALAQIIHVMLPTPQRDGGNLYPAGMQFLSLDERDRDLLFRHISVSQIEYLRSRANRREFWEPAADTPARRASLQQILHRTAWVLVTLVLAFYLVRYFAHYKEQGPSGEIQKTYEKSIRKYRGL